MIIPARNLKVLYGIHKVNLILQQYSVKTVSILNSQRKKINKWECNVIAIPSTKSAKELLNLGKYSLMRMCSNFPPKPQESGKNVNKKTDGEKDEDKKDKEMPGRGHGRSLPRLMNFPEIMWPSMLNSIKNWIMVQFIIRPYMDREFNIRDFCHGAKKAMQVVSSKLMNGDFTKLNNLVTLEALTELKPVVQKLSVSQRRQLEVKESDIYLTFPYQVGIMFDETNEKVQKRWVEITMVFHVLRGLKEMRESGEEVPWNMGTMPEYQDKVFVCNYRFVKEFTQGNESDWIINVVNHFKPIDLINEIKRM